MKANIIRTISEDYKLVEDLENDNALSVMDSDGEYILHVHPAIITLPDNEANQVLLGHISHLNRVIDKAYSQGLDHGTKDGRDEIRHMLGIDGIERIAEALEEISGRM